MPAEAAVEPVARPAPDEADRPVRVLGIGGAPRTGSWTEALLRQASLAARRQGMVVSTYSLASRPLPWFRMDLLADPPPAVAELLARVREADALILATPVYHGTIAGFFKNAVDFLEGLAGDARPWLTGRAVGLMTVAGSAASGAQAVTAMDHFCRALRATTVPTAVNAAPGFQDTEGRLVDEVLGDRIRRMCEELRRYARAAHPPAPDPPALRPR